MGWLGNVFRGIADGIKSAVNWIVEGITGLIGDIERGILVSKHKLGEWISDALDTTLGSIAVLLGIIALGVGFVFLGNSALMKTFVLTMKKVRDTIKDSLSFVAEAIKLKFLLDTNEVLMAVWSDYRDIFKPLQTAFVGLSKELGYDTSTILLITGLAKNTAVNSLRLAGSNSKANELEAMTKTQDFLSEVDAHFAAYAANPGLFMEQFDERILQPYNKDGDNAVGALYDWLDDMRNTINEKTELITAIREDLQSLQESMGPEIAAKFAEHLGPYLDKFDDFWYDNYLPTLNNVNAGFDTINAMQERNERKLEALEETQNDPILGLDKLMIMGIDDQRTFAAGLSHLSTFMVSQEYKELAPFETELRKRNRALIEGFTSNLNGPEFLRYEGGPIIPPKTPVRIKLTSWNVGEY